MFEYINPGFILIGSILLFLEFIMLGAESLEAKKEKRKLKISTFPKLTFLVVIGIIIVPAYFTKNSIESNIQSFNEDVTLECSTLTTSYLVSKRTGWRLHKDNFTKDGLLIRADKCKN